MAVAMGAAAAGLIAASQLSTAFVSSSPASSQVSSKTTSFRGATRYASSATAAPASSSNAALCMGATLGMASAAASMKSKTRVSRKAGFDPTGAVGVLEPTGFWDPCGLMKERKGKDGWEWKDEATFNNYRTAELKHGRLAMMAAGGMLANTFWKFPGFEGVPDGLKALEDGQGGSGFGIIFLIAAGIEINYPTGKFPDPLKIGEYDNWGYSTEMLNKEIANGRVAMAAVLTFWITEYGSHMGPAAQIADTNLANIGIPVLLLGFAWGNPTGWKKGEYVPSLLATSLSPKEASSTKSLPPAAPKAEEAKAEE